MLVYNNKEYRNLQEQVQKNKADIEDWKSKQETLANWGIRIVGQIEDESDLPEDYEGEYGDAYQVGTGDSAKYFAWIRPTTEVDKDHWMDMGSLSIAGPQGPAGDEISDIKFVSSEHSTVMTGDTKTDNTIRVTMSDGRTIDFIVSAYGNKGDKGDQGIQGIQGIQGSKGDKGDRGDVGPQGEMGPTAPAYHIIGRVESTEQLPDPEVLKDLSGAYLIGIQLWIQIGKNVSEAKWTYLGDIDTGSNTLWEISGSTIAPAEVVDLVQINNLDVLQSFSCQNPSITGTINGSAMLSPANLSLAGTTGVDIINNGESAISVTDNAVNINKTTKLNGDIYAPNLENNVYLNNTSCAVFYDSSTKKLSYSGYRILGTNNMNVNLTYDGERYFSWNQLMQLSTVLLNQCITYELWIGEYPGYGNNKIPGNIYLNNDGLYSVSEDRSLNLSSLNKSINLTAKNGTVNVNSSLLINGAEVQTVRRHVANSTDAAINELLESLKKDDITAIELHGYFNLTIGTDDILCNQAHIEYFDNEFKISYTAENSTSSFRSDAICTVGNYQYISADYDLAV